MENAIMLTKRLHVLFVDDERLIREMVSDMLMDSVGHISLASNGQEGLEFYLSSLRPIDIVISDQTMPVMEGLDMLTKIKEHNPSQKCVMMTAHSEAKYMLRAIEVGIEYFLTKPISFDKLDEVIADLATRIEQENLQKEMELLDKRQQIDRAFTFSFESLVNNIPLPAFIVDEHDTMVMCNDEMLSIVAGSPYYARLIAKELTFKDLLPEEFSIKNEAMFCNWKEEFLHIGNDDLIFRIEGESYTPKIKRLLSNIQKHFYVICLIETSAHD